MSTQQICGNSPGTAINSNTARTLAEVSIEIARMGEAVELRGWGKPAELISRAAALLAQASAGIMDSIDAYEDAVNSEPCLEVAR